MTVRVSRTDTLLKNDVENDVTACALLRDVKRNLVRLRRRWLGRIASVGKL